MSIGFDFMKSKQWNKILEYLQFAGYAMLISSLPLSNFFMSFSSFWLVGVWLLQVITDIKQSNSIRTRMRQFTSNKNALVLTSLYILPLVGLLWTTDFDYAKWDLRMKLPILFMPFLLTTLQPITTRTYRTLIGLFLVSLTFATLWCLLIYWHINPRPYEDVREISVFISHVRFSLLISLGIYLVFLEAWNQPLGKFFSIFISLFFLYFIYVIGSITGVMVLSVLLLCVIIQKIITSKKQMLKMLWTASLLLLILTPTMYLVHAYKEYNSVPDIQVATAEIKSQGGEVYEHNIGFPLIEHGHYVMTHIAWGELYETWNERSAISPDSLDGRGHILKGTLIRYLASKNLHKDREGINALTDEDIQAIEKGVTGIHEFESNGLDKRLDRVLFEISNYKAGGSSSGHSVMQRLEFWSTAIYIIKQHVWFGVGTGDVNKAFEDAYINRHSELDQSHRLRAHNQYLTMWVSYGVAGILLFLTILFAPVFYSKQRKTWLLFIVVASLSFFTEDTLESQAGVMFFTFFYIFFSLKKKITLSELRPVKSPISAPSADVKPPR